MKRWIKYFSTLFVIGNAGFLFSCAAIHQQQNESRDTASFNRQGLIYMKGDSQAQDPSSSKAPKMNSLLAAALNNRGIISLEDRDYVRAISDFNEAIETDPRLALPYSNRARVYIEMGDYDQAILDLDKALEIDPANTVAYSSRALAYFLKGE